ncbi:hypothetical protein BGZ88_006447 [Linnemannia elongata]|nr:hypothetical protein BGZ88_006447 [Linnemannia elongata]
MGPRSLSDSMSSFATRRIFSKPGSLHFQVSRQIQDLEIYRPSIHSLQSRSDKPRLFASGHTLAAKKARRRRVAGWDTNVAKEAQEELMRLSEPDMFTIDLAPKTSIVAVVDRELKSRLGNIGHLVDAKIVLQEEMERSDFETWPRLNKAGLYMDVDFLWPVELEEEYLRLVRDCVASPLAKEGFNNMFPFYGPKP